MKKLVVAVVFLMSLSGCGGSSTGSVIPPAPPQNQIPIANAGADQNVATTTVVTMNGSASSDVDGDTLTYAWSLTTIPAGSSASLSDPTNVSPTFSVDIDGIYIAQLLVNDGTVDSTADTVTITAATANSAPIANAGADQNVATTTVVTMNGSASSDVDGDTLTYAWSLTTIPAGSSATLSDPTNVSPTFSVDIDGIYIAQLLVNDGTVDSTADTVTITVATANSAPIANAGADQNVATTTVVTMNGSASSDVDGDTLTYAWSLTTIPAGSSASLSDPTNVSPFFSVDIDGTYVAQLLVNDGTVDSTADTVTITAATANSAPIANAGADQNVATTTVVTLNGSASSDVDGDTLTYAWSLTTIPAGSSASLSDLTSVSPTFSVDIDGIYIAQLLVNDGTVDSTADTVTITAATANSAPIANAGADQNVATTTVVTLNGSASSDVDGDTLMYAWSLTTIPAGSSASLSDPTNVSPFFSVDIDGTYIAQLLVNDGTVDSTADTVTIIAATANSVPIANAGADQSVSTGTTVFLDANGSSDADGDGLLYSWSFVSKPVGSLASFDNELAENPSFTADQNGSYVINLVVNDGLEDSVADSVVIEAIEPKVTLSLKSGGFFSGTFNEVAFPYSTNEPVDVIVEGLPPPTTYRFATFKLLAQAENFTITNLSATDSTSQVVPFFTVISDGYELVDGTDVVFDLVSPLTGGATVMLNFSFEIQETGETFSVSYTFTSN